MRQRKSSTAVLLLGLVAISVTLPPTTAGNGLALAASSTAALSVSLTITAGCSVQSERVNGAGHVAVTCDNIVPYRVESYPARVEIAPLNVATRGDPPDVRAINIMVVY